MGKKLEDYRKSTINIFGFSWPRREFWLYSGIIVGALILLTAITLCGVNLSWYGIMIALGFVLAIIFCIQLCPLRGIDKELPWSLVLWIFPLSIVGARLYYCIFHGVTDISQMIRFWEGGLAIYGGVIGGFVGVVICCLIHKVNIVKACDVIVPVLALGQCLGRIGCIFGECCYGVEVTNKALQWFPIALNVHGAYHYATNFYESILDLCIFIALVVILRKVKINGITTLSYLFGYGIVRFILEFFRDKAQTLFVGTFPVSQLLSIILVIAGSVGICVVLFVNNRKNSQTIESKK